MLNMEALAKLKEGKRFWEWHTPEGSFDMHYVEIGQGPHHILLLHSFRAHTFTWRYLLEPLAQAGYHVWAVDLIGFGLSDKPEHVTYNLDFFIKQVTDFMESKQIDKAHLIGNSMGGGIALKLGLLHPSKTSSLILLSALGYPHDLPFYVTICRHIRQIWSPFLGQSMVRHSMRYIMYDQQKISDEQVEAYTLPYRLPGGIAATLLTLQQFDNQYLIEMSQQYNTLQKPMLVIWGEQDCQIPVSHYEKFMRDFSHAQGLLIPDCGHIPQEEHPREVLKSVLGFLEKIL